MKEKKERNEQIIEMYQNRFKEGKQPVTLREIANEFGITISRLKQIVNRNKLEEAMKLYPSVFNQEEKKNETGNIQAKL